MSHYVSVALNVTPQLEALKVFYFCQLASSIVEWSFLFINPVPVSGPEDMTCKLMDSHANGKDTAISVLTRPHRPSHPTCSKLKRRI